MNSIVKCFVFLLMLMPAEGREWTNEAGQKIQADFVSSDGTTVVLKMKNGREVPYAVAKLSAGDQAFIKEQMAAKEAAVPAPAADAAPAAVTGWVKDFALGKPAFAEAKLYLAHHKNTKAVYEAFAKGAFPAEWSVNQKDVEREFAYEAAGAAAIVYVPATYDGTKPFGVYLHISPGNSGENRTEYAAVMDRMNLIYVSPKGTSNEQPMLRRVKLAVDALSSVQAQYKTDAKRICVGGLSGGGHMAMLTHAMFPGMFMGSVSHSAQSYLPSASSGGHFPGLTVRDLKTGALKDHKWCVISGEKDQNYAVIKTTGEAWESNRMNYKFFDVAGMGHENAKAGDLEAALKWVGL